MKNKTLLTATLIMLQAFTALGEDRAADTIILDEVAVKNLGLRTEVAEERLFETTVFAVGRIEEIPAKRYSVSSRIEGRAVDVRVFPGDYVKTGQVLVKVETRQAGDPPPTISLKAMSDGLVVSSHVLNGQPVQPDQDLLDVSDRSEMWAVAQIPEKHAAEIQPGSKARIVVHALGEEPITATMIRYGVSANKESGTIEGVFQIPNTDGRLLPGMRAEFSIITSARENVLSLPREAVQGDPASRVVYLRDFDLPNAFLKSPVVLGEQNDRYVEILSGLFPGEEAATKGSYLLGFVSSESGISLKEALDAAHGHEHNEDGSEITGDNKDHDDSDGHEPVNNRKEVWLRIYAAVVTLLAVLLALRKSTATQQDNESC